MITSTFVRIFTTYFLSAISGAAQVKEDGLGLQGAGLSTLAQGDSLRNLGSKLSEHAQTGLSMLLDDTDEEEEKEQAVAVVSFSTAA